MEKFKVTFEANNQQLKALGTKHASDTYADIEATFVLGEKWTDMDSVSAVWWNDFTRIATILDANGKCVVPHEVLTRKGCVRVNLVGSIVEGNELVTRLTSYSAEAVKVNEKIKLTGTETGEITPSQFEQFVAEVISEVEKVTGMAAEAETLPSGSQATARYENGVLYLGIPQGIQGEKGDDGVGIASVTLNADYTLTISLTDGSSITTTSIRGEKGEKGETGENGTTPSISIGNVETLAPNEDAYVTRRGTDAEPIFDFGLVKGDKGEDAVIPWDDILPVDIASGAIVTIPDGTDLVQAKSLKVQLEPIQEGSGTPSPDNVCPISGHTEAEAIVSPTTDAEDGHTYTTDLGRTVYGGSLDVVSGVLTVDRAYRSVTDMPTNSWNKLSSGSGAFYMARVYAFPNMKYPYEVVNPSYPISDTYAYSPSGTQPNGAFRVSDALYIVDDRYSTISEFREAYAQNPFSFVYELATPQTYQLTPTEVALLEGTNNVWGSGDVTLTYNADIQLWVLKQLS